MEQLERIAARVGRVACSPDHSTEALLESAALVSELANEFEALQQRALAAGDLLIRDPASPAPTPEELERLMRELLES